MPDMKTGNNDEEPDKKMMKMKRLFIALSLLLTLTSCYEDYMIDYDYTAAYVAYQYDLRTFVCGEDVDISFTTALGGTILNNRDRAVDVSIDNTLLTSDLSVFDPRGAASSFKALDGLKGLAPIGMLSQDYVSKEILASGITRLTPLPKSYYTTSGPVKIKKGYHTGSLHIYPTKAMYIDEKVLKPYYALGYVVNSVDADSLIRDKSFQIMAVKVENRFYGNWYHGGRRLVIRNEDGAQTLDDRYSLTVPQPDKDNYVITTESFNSVTTDKIANQAGCLRLTFLDDNKIRVEDATGNFQIEETPGRPSHHNGAKLIQDREIYLNYRYSNKNGTTSYVTDTLRFRNRIRDGINEWQDENTEHYK